MPGLKRILCGHNVQLGPGANTLLDSETCFLQLRISNLLVQDFLCLQGSYSLLLCSPATWRTYMNCENTRILIAILEAVPQAR